ncbi:centrosome-associated protein 350 isoform X2 [Mugil cephalus]|uniref:centrosome-associated protein 350 isoform X2 n=1 Tax=Mugil cephalus TaxID=48193 RepID=UPI001FB632D9|nr:centrosome-associated protein 350 isoform X2 [Mugil cephalus]
MRSSRTEVSLKNSAQQPTDHNIATELTTAWNGSAQSKAALRHIENRIEATPGTGVLLDCVSDFPKKKSSRTVRSRDGQQVDDLGRSSKPRGGSQQSPEKNSSRSPLRNTTQDSNVRRNNSVEFREPLASYREATPPLHPSAQLEAYSLHSVPGSSYPSSLPPSDPLASQLVYQRDTRDKQTDRDLDSTHSSALESTEVCYLNDQPALDTLRMEESTPKAQLGMDSKDSSPCIASTSGTIHRGESTSSTSPGSASQRLENLRRHQPDDKLEKLKERIRRQRQHLEETAEREKLLSYLEQPTLAFMESSNPGTRKMPTTKIRKVAAAPPAPIYKGFNSTETKIQTPDGKVWKEEEFHNLSREIYRDLSRQFAESTRSRPQQQREPRADRSKERPKPIRKVHKAAPASDLISKAVISPASWREGQKLVKMVLGPVPKMPREEDSPYPSDRRSRTASNHRSEQRSESNRRSRSNSTERTHSRSQGQPKSRSATTSNPLSAAQDKAPVGASTDLLSADIQGILDDLQLEYKAVEKEERARKRSRSRGSSGRRGRGGSGSRTRTPVSAWGTTVADHSSSRVCRSTSPTTHRPETGSTVVEKGQKRRHYDADTVRQYIARQQEERKRRQVEEKRAMKEEADRRNQRLQELYRKQREVARTVAFPAEAPVQKRLQETYTKLLLEGDQLGEEATQTHHAAPSNQMRPMYQPSGESDKENKRLEAPQSPSSSDRSLNDQPPLSRIDLDLGVTSLLQSDHLYTVAGPVAGPSISARAPDHLLSHLLRLERAVAASDNKHTQRPATSPSIRSQSKMSRIEAIKATAASLSNRIESEARKLVGEGVNYGTPTTMDVDTILPPRQSSLDGGCWAESAACATDNNDMALRIQRILTSTSHSSFNSTALPGAGNQHALTEQEEKNDAHISFSNPHMTFNLVGPVFGNYSQEKRKLVNGLEKEERVDQGTQRKQYDKEENQTDIHDSSAGSISEGPLLSEDSFSEDEVSPSQPSKNRVPRSADQQEAVAYAARQRKDYQRLLGFQREAAMCTALSSPVVQHSSNKTAWEELNKGSPLSVINIFTKNLHGHVKASERNSERNSPSANSLRSGSSPGDAAAYEDDFVSSHSSRASGLLKRGSNSPSMNSHFEELIRRSPYEKSTGGIYSHHSSFHSSNHSPHLSSGSTPGSSPLSRHSARKRASDQSDATLVEEQQNSCSPPSEVLSSDSRNRGSGQSSAPSQAKSVHSNDTSGETSGHSHQRARLASPSGSRGSGSPPGADSPSESVRLGSLGANIPNSAYGGRAEARSTGELRYSPAVLQQRMAAELQYLESIEESVRQLGDVERLVDVSMAQQESASLAQMLKAKQQRHERDLYELKIKAEREALEAQLQQEENRQRVARAQLEVQESLAAAQKEALEDLQESTTKMMSQQAEAARYTVDAARHIKEMTELARSQMAGTLIVPPVHTDSSMLDQRQDRTDSDSLGSDVSSRKTRPEEPLSLLNSLSHSDSLSFRRPNLSGAASSSPRSASHVSSESRERAKKEAAQGKWRNGEAGEKPEREAASSSIEEEVPAAANYSLCSDSIPSVVDEKGESTSVATEYSLKFDESMTEDEIEERSFRSLLPSEAHRRGTMEKKSRHREESEDDGANHNTTLVSGSRSNNTLKSQDASMVFSGGQDSFSQFTMDMVRQYMKDEEVRLQHQSSLLHLRQKALKEKTRAELAWLEHQKKRLRDKGEDDKMPPIRKKQRGLLMKLQQEQAEIKRLQEANKAARKERQLLLKQQEEIERMRNSTHRLKERLKCVGGEAPPETPVSETPCSEPASPSMRHAEDVRSPSPSLSVSGSETSSIMQKLKKMRSHMDEKHCSPVHYFLSVFTAHNWASLSVCLPNLQPKFQLFIYNQLVRFLTKREQQLMQRRHHAEELLQWKQRLDQEEAEVRRMEKEALAVWDQKTRHHKNLEISESKEMDVPDSSSRPSHHQSSGLRTDSEKEYVSEGDISSATPEYSIHTEGLESQQLGSPSPPQPASVSETSLASVQSSPLNYTQDFSSGSQSPSRKSSLKGSRSPAGSPSDGSSKTKMQLQSTSWTTNQASTQPTDPPMATQTETISDQSDIESRIKALKEELRKRKIMAYQLKKEQKKRNKERLKAQEASLLKQLENYNNFIEKTKAELNKAPDSTPDVSSQIKDSNSVLEQSIVIPPTHRSETSYISDSKKIQTDASLHHNAIPEPGQSRSTSVPEDLFDEEQPTMAGYGSPECPVPEHKFSQSTEPLLRSVSKEDKAKSEDESIVSDYRSDIQEELDVSSKLDDEDPQHLLRLEKEDGLDFQERLSTSKHGSSSINEEHQYSPSVSQEQDNLMKQREISETEDTVKSNITAFSQKQSPAVDLKTSSQPSYSYSSGDHSRSPESFATSSNKESPIKDIEASPTADGYHDDFESSVDSSPREDHPSSKLESQLSFSPTEIKSSRNDSQDEVVEEDIAEELSHHSGTSEPSHQSGRLLDLHKQPEDFKSLIKSNDSGHSPPVSPLQTPLSLAVDEMLSFNIGDRVLVGGVQPGTLRFKGPTSFANGFWAGVELDKPEGSNNGTYDGIVYFECEECHGIFAPPDKITHLPDKFEVYTDTTEDEDSFFDDFSEKGRDTRKTEEDNKKQGSQKQGNLEKENDQTSHNVTESGDKKVIDESLPKSQFISQRHEESEHPISNGDVGDVMLDFEDASHTPLISDIDKIGLMKQSQKIVSEDVNYQSHSSPADLGTDIRDENREHKNKDLLDTFADKLLHSFVKDTVQQFAVIKKAKQQKIEAANQKNGDLFGENVEEEWMSLVEQKDGLPFFLPADKEELSSPELCNRPSPVLGASGQEELAKRLAELELSRELLDELGDDQDWFDEDFGLSSRREQQRLKQEEEEARLGGGRGGLARSGSSAGTPMGAMVSSSGGEPQVKTPPRPELPLPLPPKLPEQPAMVVPHSATEVEKMVHAATQEIWERCDLGKRGTLSLTQMPIPQPSQDYLGKEAGSQDQEALSICSYRKAVYDLTWEILEEIYAEDPNTDQPQWVKPRRVKSSFHKVKTPGNLTKVQEFITAEVLKLYGLAKDENQKTDWQKMLKFGRKKRDRVDHILVQELHEEESQWVNYDEDELFVKMQLADSIFDALLKDTANTLTLISDKRARRSSLS